MRNTSEARSPLYPIVWLFPSGQSTLQLPSVFSGRGWHTVAPDRGNVEEWLGATQAALDEVSLGPVHVIAAQDMAHRVLSLGAHASPRLASIQLVDPEVDISDASIRDDMRRITAPTLVIAAAPTRDTPLAGAQAVAGTVDNGVMVVIDDREVPLHQSAPDRVVEWIAPFTEIAEGLWDLRPDRNTDPDPM